MTALAVAAAELQEPQGNDLLPCPNCLAQVGGPTSTSYLGLGRIEHVWQCHRCGEAFRTTARMAGMVEPELHESTAATG